MSKSKQENTNKKPTPKSIVERWRDQSEVPIVHGKKKVHKRDEKDRVKVK